MSALRCVLRPVRPIVLAMLPPTELHDGETRGERLSGLPQVPMRSLDHRLPITGGAIHGVRWRGRPVICFIAAIPTIVTAALFCYLLLLQYLWLTGQDVPRQEPDQQPSLNGLDAR